MENKQSLVPGLKEYVNHYGIKKDRWGRLLFYKAITNTKSSIHVQCHSRPYRDGACVSCTIVDYSRSQDCGKGLHVATLAFAKDFANSRYEHVVLVAVEPEDVVCVPLYGSGKIRCKKLYVYGRVSNMTGELLTKHKGPRP